MPAIPRAVLMQKFHDMAARGVPIVGGGAGTGLSAKCEEAGGIDLIVIYNSGRYRMAGRGSMAGLLAYGNANDIVLEMAREVLPVVRHTPVLAGVNGTDPFCLFDSFLDHLKAIGFSGIQNFPTVGIMDGLFRANLEETGMGFGLEVDLVRLAHAKDLLTTPYVFNPDESTAMAEAGADIIVAHMGVTTGGTIGAGTAASLQDCVPRIDAIAEAARRVRPDIFVLCHGGPIAMPEDAQFILDQCRGIHGFYGASSMERLPTEIALTEQTRRFKAIARPHGKVAIGEESPLQEAVRELLRQSDEFSQALYPPESNYLVSSEDLAADGVRFFVARLDGAMVGCGALLGTPPEGEIKRMFVTARARGLGVGAAILQALEAAAQTDGIATLRLESGIHNAAALQLYDRAGYAERGPFGPYRPDPLSVFMEKRLS